VNFNLLRLLDGLFDRFAFPIKSRSDDANFWLSRSLSFELIVEQLTAYSVEDEIDQTKNLDRDGALELEMI
jgi:hypothetical protein